MKRVGRTQMMPTSDHKKFILRIFEENQNPVDMHTSIVYKHPTKY